MKNIRPDLRLNVTKKGEQNQCSKNGRGGGQLLAQNNVVLNENTQQNLSKKLYQNTANISPYNTHSFKINFQLFAQEKTKSKKFTITLISIILACVLAVAFLPIVLINKNANAFTNDDTANYVTVGELWNSTDKKFNPNNTITLLKYLSSDGTINGVSTSATASNIRDYTYNGKSADKAVVVTLGRLKWQVVYLTTDKSGNKVATLWLTNSTQDAFSSRSSTEGAYYGYLNGGLYSDWSSNWYDSGSNTGKYPSNMYSTSYIRVVTLNNGGQYSTGSLNNNSSTLSSTVSKSTTSAFAPFTVTSNGLTDYIVQPKNISYQTETTSTSNPLQNGTNNGLGYYLNNESINRGGNSGSYNYYNTTITYAKYGEWGNDYIWLPSMSEMGISGTAGIWAVNETERKNYDGSTTSSLGKVGSTSDSVYANFWSRSAYVSYSLGACSVNPSGDSRNDNRVNNSYAVRPALHLNLSLSSKLLMSISSNNESYGSVSGAGQYESNTTATITATPNSGYLFDYWMIGSNRIEKNPYSFIITEDTSVTAYFKAGCLVTLNTNNANYGSVLGAGTYESGTPITLTASPKPGYAFSYWLDGGGGRYDSNVIQTTITSNLTFTAYFEPIYGLNITSATSFTQIVKDDGIYETTYYITPASGNYIHSIQVGSNPAQIVKYRSGILDYSGSAINIHYEINQDGSRFSLSVICPIETLNITLVFTNQAPTLSNPASGGAQINGVTVMAGVGGEVRMVGNDIANGTESDQITVIAVAYSGYTFAGWVYADNPTQILSTNFSQNFSKSEANGKIIKAIFSTTSTSNINDETNSKDNGGIL